MSSTKDATGLMFFVYIIYSDKLGKFYVGSTNDVQDRLYRHNSGQSTFTKSGCPWRLVTTFEFAKRSEAIYYEKKIKKRGIARHLRDINFPTEWLGQ